MRNSRLLPAKVPTARPTMYISTFLYMSPLMNGRAITPPSAQMLITVVHKMPNPQAIN
ncbi:hypothetical protein DPMN_117083 [Dreissena polymorpha]|uniref:Uncharacterized protein n=1 Tax=Dreissena polymorpha TaxID=45954 RepID=A0A9D4KPC3_DREPO|nr:hypothetical protein DPMN_117083 [Dreissena polymorpha]